MKEQEEGRQCYWSLRHGREGSDRSYIRGTRATAARIRAGRGGRAREDAPASLLPSGPSSVFPSLFRLPVSLFCLPVSVLVPPIGQTKLQPDVTLGLGVCRPQPPGAQRRTEMWAMGAERHGRPNSTDPRSIT